MSNLNTNYKYIVFLLIAAAVIIDFHQSKASSELESNQKSWGCIKTYRATIFLSNTTSSPKVTRLKKNTPVEILENKMGWSRIKGMRQEGWIKSFNLIKGLKCALITHDDILVNKSEKHPLTFHQPVKILKQGFGKNLIQDRYRNTFWVYSRGLWPKDPQIQKTIEIP